MAARASYSSLLVLNSSLVSAVLAPRLRSQAAASNVRTPTCSAKLRVSSMMPASRACASSGVMLSALGMNCSSSQTSSLAEEA